MRSDKEKTYNPMTNHLNIANKLILVMHDNFEFVKKLESHVSDAFAVIEKQTFKSIHQEIRTSLVSCVIFHVKPESILKNTQLEQFKKRFSHIPCIVVVTFPDIEFARYCGFIGIERVLLLDKIQSINEEIIKICAKNNNNVSIEDLSIDKNESLYSPMIKESFSIMERDYLKIFNISEIANLLEIKESTLSREFCKFGLPGPKKILMFFKINHAIKLMQNKGLNIYEISCLSGFSNEKRMAECFHRMFGMPPGEYRIKHVNSIGQI